MKIQSTAAYPRFTGYEKSVEKEPLRNYANISYTEVTPKFKHDQKAFLGLIGGSMGLSLSAALLSKPLHQGLKKALPIAAKKVSVHFIEGSLAFASIGSFLGAIVKAVSMSNRHTKQFTLKNVELHALRGGNAQQLQRLG